MSKWIGFRCLLIFQLMFLANIAEAEDCLTVLECAQLSVEAAEAAQKAVEELRAENAVLRQQIATHRQELDAAITTAKASALAEIRGGDVQNIPNSGNSNSNTSVCPVGSYMIGAKFRIDKGGPHGIVSSIYPVCRVI